MVARVSAVARSGFLPTAGAILAFGAAFGFVEAAVVVYLRAALGLVPGTVMAHDPGTFGTFEAVEIARELATLVMISAVGWLAGHRGLERLAWAAVVFGTWDPAYYAGLRLTIDWPPSLATRDVLFLVPGPWVGPVWAPLVVSAALVITGFAAAHRLRSDDRIAVGPWHAVTALAGGALVVGSFLIQPTEDPLSPWTAWPVFWLGMMLAIAATVSALAGWPATLGRRPLLHRSESRPPVGSPD